VKKIALLLVLVAACKTVAVRDPNSTGAGTPRATLDRFLAAAKAQDLQALGADFGNDKGPLRDQADRSMVEKQLLIQLRCLRFDKATISDPIRGVGGTQVFVVDFTQGRNTATVHFTVVKGPSDRWYVEVFEIVVLQNKGFCTTPGA
jgi:hypothetical protein